MLEYLLYRKDGSMEYVRAESLTASLDMDFFRFFGWSILRVRAV